MRDGDRARGWWFAGLLLVLLTFSVPSEADAGVKVGVDGIWVPTATLEVGGVEVDASHQISSFGVSGYGTTGVGPLDVGLKLNYFNSGFEIAGRSGRLNEIDVNALGQFSIPGIGLSVIGEAGLAINTDAGGVGYDLVVGGRYTVLSLGPIGIDSGLMGQWTTFESDRGGNIQSFRLLVPLGLSFGF